MQLRVTRLLNGNIVGGVITTQAVASAGQFVPARDTGRVKGSRRAKIAQAASTTV